LGEVGNSYASPPFKQPLYSRLKDAARLSTTTVAATGRSDHGFPESWTLERKALEPLSSEFFDDAADE